MYIPSISCVPFDNTLIYEKHERKEQGKQIISKTALEKELMADTPNNRLNDAQRIRARCEGSQENTL